MRTIADIWPCFIVVLVLSCQHKEPEPLTPAARTIGASEQAIDDVSMARCDYEQRCNHVGFEMRYADRKHCMNVMRYDAQQDLDQCRDGVNQDDLRECMMEIANEDCAGPFRRLGEFAACHMDDLCRLARETRDNSPK
jgi:hypothetical protein